MTQTEFIPAEVFHPAQMIADEAIARDWSIWDFVDRVGTLKPPVDVLAFKLYAASAEFDDMELRRTSRMSDHFPLDMERVFGISADVWRRSQELCRAYPDRIAPLDDFAAGWYGLNDDESAASLPSSESAET